MAISKIVSFLKRSPFLKVVSVLAIGTTGGSGLSGVLSQAIDHSGIDFTKFIDGEFLALWELGCFGCVFGFEDGFEG